VISDKPVGEPFLGASVDVEDPKGNAEAAGHSAAVAHRERNAVGAPLSQDHRETLRSGNGRPISHRFPHSPGRFIPALRREVVVGPSPQTSFRSVRIDSVG